MPEQAHKTGTTMSVWFSQMYKYVLRCLNKSLSPLNSTNDTIRCEKSWIYSYESLMSKKNKCSASKDPTEICKFVKYTNLQTD